MDLRSQLPGRFAIVAERLLNNYAPGLCEAGLGQPLDHSSEQKRRDLEIEDGASRLADRARDALISSLITKVAADLGQPAGEPVTDVVIDRLAAPLNRRLGMAAEVLLSQSLTATPTIGQSNRPRCSSR